MVFQPRSLCCLSLNNPIRKFCIRLAQNKWFDRVVVFVIILNCLVLSLMDPLDTEGTSLRTKIQDESELWFTIAFTIELVVKVVAMGLVGKGSYLSDRWNWLDFVVVIVGYVLLRCGPASPPCADKSAVACASYVSMAPGVDNVSSLRTFRVLRPLRTLSTIPEMAVIVKSMLASIPALFNVFLLCVFIFFIFGIIGLQLWVGVLRGRCAYTHPQTNLQVVDEATFCAIPCAAGESCSASFGDDCSAVDVTYHDGSSFVTTSVAATCVNYENPRYGLISFDNIGVACMTIFTSITLEGWVDVMYALNAAWGVDVFVVIYFVLLIMFGSFFLLNLALAVIWDEYVKATEAFEEKQAEEKAELERVARVKEEADARDAAIEAQATVDASAPSSADAGAGGVAHGNNPDAAAGTAANGGDAGAGGAVLVAVHSANDDDGDAGEAVRPQDQEGNGGDVPKGFWGGCCYRDRHHGYLYYFVESMAFNSFIVGLILLNTATLACEHYEMSDTFKGVLDGMNLTFTIAFGAEMILKIMGLGLCGYLASSWNRFDCIIVIISFVEIGLDAAGQGGSGGGLGALRTFRLMRVLRLARTWEDLRNLLITIVKSIKDVANASVVLLIVMFIFCLLGMQLFGGQMGAEKFGGVQPRAHFDNLWWSFVTVFQVLTGENWNEVLYDAVEATGGQAIVFFLLLNVVGNYLILNLFLAILLGNFDTVDDDDEEESADDAASGSDALKDGAAAPAGASNAIAPTPKHAAGAPAGAPQLEDRGTGAASDKYLITDADESKEARIEMVEHKPQTAGADAGAGGAANPLNESSTAHAWAGETDGGVEEGVVVAEGADKSPPPKLGELTGKSSKKKRTPTPKKKLKLSKSAFYVFRDTNPLRLLCARVVNHKYFDPFILFLIAVSTILLAMDEPRVERCKDLPASDPDNCIVFNEVLVMLDTIITWLFVIEMVLKVMTLGFIAGPNHYLRNPWNILDFIIVVVSLVSMALGGSTELKALRSLRALRALRPLRVVSRYPGLRLVVNSIFGALPKVRNVMLVNLLFMLIFGIVGVQNWMGAMHSCNDPSRGTKAECVGIFVLQDEQCGFLPLEADQVTCRQNNGTAFPRVWEPPMANFDNTGNALLTVFEVASGEMWPNIMYEAVDSVGLDLPKERDASPAAALFFILINIVCSFFMLEIFTGVVIDNFNKMKEAAQGSALLTHEQQMWVETMKMMLGTQPVRRMKPPAGCAVAFRRIFFRIANFKYFEHFIMSMILVNTSIMALVHYDQGSDWDLALNILNYFFAGLFAAEAAIKLLGFGVKQYFSIGWNRFDFILVILSFVGETVDLGQLATLLRIVRVARIFRLVRTSRGLQTMFKTLLFSFPQLLNVGAVLLLVFFIYAVVGMNLFADIKRGEFLNDDANFGSFFTTMVTLFRMSTGESYNGLMHDCMIEEPYCDPDTNCGFPGFAPIYFISFYVLSAFILLNLLIAIILDNFMDTVALDEGRQGFVLKDTDMAAFQAVWSRFDPTASKFIPAGKMVNVLLELEYPLGLKNTRTCRPCVFAWPCFARCLCPTRLSPRLALFPVCACVLAAGVTHDSTLRKQARVTLLDMDIPEHEGRVFFHEVLKSLAARACGPIDVPSAVPILSDLERQQNRIMKSVHKAATSHVHEHMAAQRMQSAFRGHMSRRAVEATAEGGKQSEAGVTPGGLESAAGAAPTKRTVVVASPDLESGAGDDDDEADVQEVQASDDVGHAGANLPRPPSSKLNRRGSDGAGVERSGSGRGADASGEEVTPIGVPLGSP